MSVRAILLDGGAARLADLRLVMREPYFARYAYGHFLSNIGFWMQRIAVGWLVWTLTGSKAWLGVIAFAELFPSLISSMLGGMIADRVSRPRLNLVCQVGAAAVSFLLFWGQLQGDLDVWDIGWMMILLGIIAGVNLPARLSMPHELVRGTLLPSALAVNTTTFNLSRLLGPAIAAPLLLFAGAEAVFFLAFLGNAAFVVALVPIAWRPRAVLPRANAPIRTVLQDLIRDKVVMGVMLLQFAQGAVIRPASELFPAFADRVFALGETGLALLNGALGVGAIVGALALAKPRKDDDALRLIMTTSMALALTLAVFALTQDIVWALVVLVVHGAAMSGSNNAAMAYVQLHTDPARLGRVLGVYGLVFRVAPAIGALMFGLTAELLGLGVTTVTFAVAGAVATLAYWRSVQAARAEPAAAEAPGDIAPPRSSGGAASATLRPAASAEGR